MVHNISLGEMDVETDLKKEGTKLTCEVLDREPKHPRNVDLFQRVLWILRDGPRKNTPNDSHGDGQAHQAEDGR
jgi:hypothetical protein